MPEFVMPKGRNYRRFDNLDNFTQGYVRAAFFTIDEELNDKTFDDLDGTTLARFVKDSEHFQGANASILALAYASSGYSEERAGIDFWFTRNGHGAGYWDREELTGLACGKNNETNAGKVLADRARGFGNVDLYAGDDGRLYLA